MPTCTQGADWVLETIGRDVGPDYFEPVKIELWKYSAFSSPKDCCNYLKVYFALCMCLCAYPCVVVRTKLCGTPAEDQHYPCVDCAWSGILK